MTDHLERLRAALVDHYRLERELGAGGMATVYLAEDLKHRRQVAIKVLRPDLAASLGPERFLREVTIAANLQHPHVLPLYDSGQAGGFLYYVMPYVAGTSLRQKLLREGELPIPEAVRILRDLADAMAYAHAHGVVHRDIKPENVMLSGRHALVTDFGVAKAVSEATGRQTLTTAGVALGTPAYMAPEQAAADPHTDHRADIYAFGVVAYELLTGRPPFTGASPQAVLAAHVTTAAEPVTKHRASIPPGLAGLVMKCLEKKPADRWQSAEELVPQLEAALTPSGGMTPTTTQPVRVPRRRLGAKILAGVAAIAAVLLATYALVRPARREPVADWGEREAVMVLPFEAQGSDPALTAAGLRAAELVQSAIGQAGIGRLVTRSVVADSGQSQAGTLVRVLLRQKGDTVEVQTRILRSADGKVLFELGVEQGPTAELDQVIDRAKERVLAALAMYLDPLWRPWETTLWTPAANLAAYRLAAEAFRTTFERGGSGVALRLEAARLDTGYVSNAINLASAMYDLGRYREMDSLDRWVAARRDRLAPGDAAWLAWSEARHAGSPEDEYRAALALFRLDSTAAAYTVLLSAVTANRMTDALRHAARRPDTTTVMGRNWAPWYNLEVWALHSLGRLDEALRLVRQARARQPDNPVHLYSEASQLAALGRLAEADTLVAVAYGFPHPFAPLQVQENIALEVLAHGRPKDAEQRFQRLLDATEALPPTLTPADSQIIRRARAELFLRVGALAEARLAYAAVGGSVALLGRGQIAAQLGDSTEVRQVVAELLADTTRWLQGRNRRAAAGILGAAGQCEPAVRLLRDALNRGARVEGAHLHEPVWAPIRECEAFQALARPR